MLTELLIGAGLHRLKLAERKGVLANFDHRTGRRFFGSRPRLYSALLLVDRMLLLFRGDHCVSVIRKHTWPALFKAGAPDFLSFHKLWKNVFVLLLLHFSSSRAQAARAAAATPRSCLSTLVKFESELIFLLSCAPRLFFKDSSTRFGGFCLTISLEMLLLECMLQASRGLMSAAGDNFHKG